MARRNGDANRRIQILMDIWNKILDLWDYNGGLSREDVVNLLKEVYKEEGLSPIKGASTPSDIFDKEMASLYVVGKYGMGLDVQYPGIFNEVFSKETKYEQVISVLMTESPDKAKEKTEIILGKKPSDNEIARILRLKLTEVYFGFTKEDSLISLLNILTKAFPEKEKLASKYARFYIALKVARTIASGDIKDRLTKEALKQATALKVDWLKGAIPDDNYIATIANEVFGIPRKLLKEVLQLNGKKRKNKKIKT